MKLVSGILGLTLTSVVALASANAADIYQPSAPGGYKDGPAYVAVNWSGFYAGVNGGYGWDAKSNDFLSPSGGFGGGQIGYNWQRGNIVFGLETDIQGAGIEDKNVFGDKSKLDYFGTVRGRVGYAFDRTLFYATGGFAYGEVQNTYVTLAPFGKFSETQTGYTVGGGVEYKINPAWSVKAEYQYIDLGASNLVGPLGQNIGGDTEVHTVRAGLNYHVGVGYEPLK